MFIDFVKGEEVGAWFWWWLGARAASVISTVLKWECFQWGDVSSSDSFDKCQEDSQAGHNQGDSSTLKMRRRRKDNVQAFAGVLL